MNLCSKPEVALPATGLALSILCKRTAWPRDFHDGLLANPGAGGFLDLEIPVDLEKMADIVAIEQEGVS